MGRDVKVAVGTSFIFIFMVAISSLIGHSRLGNIDWRTGVFLALGGVVGAQLGPIILEYVSEQNFKRFFSILLIGTGLWLFYQTRAAS